MAQTNPDNVTFQVTVSQLTVSSELPEKDIRVTIAVGNMSKMTCAGEKSEDALIVTWNHPFLLTASPSTVVKIGVSTLPEQLTSEWDKKPFGGQVVTNVSSLLESGNGWQCNVSGSPANSAILYTISKVSDVLNVPNGHDCISALMEDHWRLYKFGRQFKNVACVATCVEVNLARLDLFPLGNANHINILNDLGVAYSLHYYQGGNISDLNRAIEVKQRRLDLCPLNHPEHLKALGELSKALWDQYYINKNGDDLNRLIEMQERWLNLCPSGHLDHAGALGELAVSLSERYNKQGGIIDLNRAIEMGEKRLALCPPGHSDHDTALNNLAVSMNARYRKLRNLADLDRDINLKQKCLQLRPPGHYKYGLTVQNLAMSHWDRYNKLQNLSDLTMSIDLIRKALQTYAIQHPQFAFNVTQLAATTLLLSNSSQKSHFPDQHFPSINEVFETYKLLKKCGAAISVDLWVATQAWVKNAEQYNHFSIIEAYQTSLNTLVHFTNSNSSLDSRHGAMQGRVAGLANDAFSCAIRHGELQVAVVLLEQGRGILWNQLARFDISLAALESQGIQGRDLCRKFTRLSGELRKHAHQSGTSSNDPYWRANEEWQSVVDRIRRMDGFSRFLLPPIFEDLQLVAEEGPVIIVNASKYTCDALIILVSRPPVHIDLPCSLSDVNQLCSQLLELTRDAHAYGTHRESYVKLMLRDLWSSVVEPIFAVLQKDIQVPPGSRIWWCPTSKFTMLPFHAAGPHRKTQKNLMDVYVSSYAPSLSALIRTRERIRAQRVVRGTSGKTSVTSFAAIGQGRPSADVNLGELPEVERELKRIRNETGMPVDVEFETVTGEAATIEGAVQAFRNHHWIHIACHGAQHAEKPFDSWFAMRDGKLTLMRIIRERYINSEFAFLSACHTAVGDVSTPDEVLHLAAGMQFAGFNGVIGTLWRVDDAVAHQMVTRFYKEMFKRPMIGFEHAAAALNTAALETTEEVSLEKRIVFVHIGI